MLSLCATRGRATMTLQVVSFEQIGRILDVTDSLGLHREWVEIPLSPESPGVVRTLSNGKLDIVVDAEPPFEERLTSLPARIHRAQRT